MNRDATARFARDVAALAAPDARVLVAVSGGPDSVALLLLAHAVFGERCVAATVDHGLRDESGKEARWVARLCATRGIPHAILTGPLPDRAGRTANLSARARLFRYALLAAEADRVGADRIATAHHADDQVETLVMRLNRGAGIAGLAGVRGSSGRVIRPLLGWRKAELAAVVAEAGIVPVDDPSNVSDRFDRARLRKALAGTGWLDVDRWAMSAAALADAEEAIGWTVDRLAGDRCAFDESSATLRPDDLPFELRRRLVERCVRHLAPDAEPRGGAVARAVQSLDAGRDVTIAGISAKVQAGDSTAMLWRFSLAPPRRTA
ncbi:MAG: tRNA lysidine(34) synthetase TilS [Sphingomonas sp.]|nr:tRNA lysidine(34) synthetase TilS [Sphingomonas sp.]